MTTLLRAALICLLALGAWAAAADDLTRMVQAELAALGYEPGNTDGELDTATIVAISRFQAEHDLEVTGEPSPQLVGIMKAKRSSVSAAPAAPAKTPQQVEAERQAAERACIQEKIEAKQQAAKTKRGLGRLFNAVARTAGQMGNTDVYQVGRDVNSASATIDDLNAAAEDLGLTEDDLAECRNAP